AAWSTIGNLRDAPLMLFMGVPPWNYDCTGRMSGVRVTETNLSPPATDVLPVSAVAMRLTSRAIVSLSLSRSARMASDACNMLFPFRELLPQRGEPRDLLVDLGDAV